MELKPQLRVTGKLEQKKMLAIGIARKWGTRTWGFYCTQISKKNVQIDLKKHIPGKSSVESISEFSRE